MQKKTSFDNFFNQIYHLCMCWTPLSKEANKHLHFSVKSIRAILILKHHVLWFHRTPGQAQLLSYSQVKTYFFLN